MGKYGSKSMILSIEKSYYSDFKVPNLGFELIKRLVAIVLIAFLNCIVQWLAFEFFLFDTEFLCLFKILKCQN